MQGLECIPRSPFTLETCNIPFILLVLMRQTTRCDARLSHCSATGSFFMVKMSVVCVLAICMCLAVSQDRPLINCDRVFILEDGRVLSLL